MKQILIAAIIVVFAVSGMSIWSRAGRHPEIVLKVVDSAGRPIQGAEINPDGIRQADGAHGLWNEHTGNGLKPVPVKTDRDGLARITYPKYFQERVRTTEISLRLAHPEYISERPFVKVASPIRSDTPLKNRLAYMWQDFSRRGTIQTLSMNAGGIMEVAASFQGKPVPAGELLLELAFKEGHYRVDPPNIKGEKALYRQLPNGELLARAAWIDEGGKVWFSKPANVVSAPGTTNTVQLGLEPGIQVKGKLTNLSGPVREGWINCRVIYEENGWKGSPLMWTEYAPVSADGSFVLDSLPAGRLEVIAHSEGHLSQSPMARGSLVRPQTWDLQRDTEITVSMEQTAAAHIKVVGAEGQPIENATVTFFPNQEWAKKFSTILRSDFRRSIELIHPKRRPRPDRPSRAEFIARTDQTGSALIKELPPLAESFSVTASGWELPLDQRKRRIAQITLASGSTNYLTVTMQKAGTEIRE